jgi:hypothetical protein
MSERIKFSVFVMLLFSCFFAFSQGQMAKNIKLPGYNLPDTCEARYPVGFTGICFSKGALFAVGSGCNDHHAICRIDTSNGAFDLHDVKGTGDLTDLRGISAFGSDYLVVDLDSNCIFQLNSNFERQHTYMKGEFTNSADKHADPIGVVGISVNARYNLVYVLSGRGQLRCLKYDRRKGMVEAAPIIQLPSEGGARYSDLYCDPGKNTLSFLLIKANGKALHIVNWDLQKGIPGKQLEDVDLTNEVAGFMEVDSLTGIAFEGLTKDDKNNYYIISNNLTGKSKTWLVQFQLGPQSNNRAELTKSEIEYKLKHSSLHSDEVCFNDTTLRKIDNPRVLAEKLSKVLKDSQAVGGKIVESTSGGEVVYKMNSTSTYQVEFDYFSCEVRFSCDVKISSKAVYINFHNFSATKKMKNDPQNIETRTFMQLMSKDYHGPLRYQKLLDEAPKHILPLFTGLKK